MIPIIEKAGGKVLVRADVTDIICEGNKAVGVKVHKGTQDFEIRAPTIISNAGAYNTFQKLLPKHVSSKSYFSSLLKGN